MLTRSLNGEWVSWRSNMAGSGAQKALDICNGQEFLYEEAIK